MTDSNEIHKISITDPKPTNKESDTNNQELQMKRKFSITPEMKKLLGIALVVIVLGVGSGFGLYRMSLGAQPGPAVTMVPGTEEQDQPIELGVVYGSDDTDTFSDQARGHLKKGGINGEGSHRLLRPGGPMQTVYLTSSVLDMDRFIGHEVEIWGETFAAQKAAWLMDVGRIEVIEMDTEPPFEED